MNTITTRLLLCTLCIINCTSNALSVGHFLPLGTIVGAVLALASSDSDNKLHDDLTTTASGAIVGGLLGAGCDLIASTCFPSEEQRHINRLQRAQKVYANSSTLAPTQQYLKRHYNALNNEKIALGICCRRLVTNKSLDYTVRCKLQEKYELLHAQISQLMITYKNRLDNLYGQQDWLACSKKRYYVPAFLQRNKPSATVRIGVRQVVR